MNKQNFSDVKFKLDLSLSIDTDVRRIQELVKLCFQIGDSKLLQSLRARLLDSASAVESLISEHLPDADNKVE